MKNFQTCFAILLLIAASSFKFLSTASNRLPEDNSNSLSDYSLENPDIDGKSTEAKAKTLMEYTTPLSKEDKVTRFCSYLPYAKEAEAATGIHAAAILAQAALESGWGEYAVGNMFFGIKDNDKGKTGNGQLLKTTEYFNSPDQGHLFPKVYSITWNKKRKMWKYIVLDWFKKYDSPADSFKDHAQLLVKNERYAKAMEHAADPVRFVQEIAKAGYATAPGYANLMVKMVAMIQAENARQIGS